MEVWRAPDARGKQGMSHAMTTDRVSALVFLAFSIAYGVLATEIPVPPFMSSEPFTPRTMPYALSALGIALALAMLATSGPPRRARTEARAAEDLGADAEAAPPPEKPKAPEMRWGKVLILAAVMCLYGLTLKPLGFIVSTSLFLIAGYLVLGERRVWILLAASIPIVVAFWALLTQLLGIYLDPGALFSWLGGR